MKKDTCHLLNRVSRSEVHADASEPAGDRRTTCVNLGGGAHPCHQE